MRFPETQLLLLIIIIIIIVIVIVIFNMQITIDLRDKVITLVGNKCDEAAAETYTYIYMYMYVCIYIYIQHAILYRTYKIHV